MSDTNGRQYSGDQFREILEKHNEMQGLYLLISGRHETLGLPLGALAEDIMDRAMLGTLYDRLRVSRNELLGLVSEDDLPESSRKIVTKIGYLVDRL